MPVHMQREIDRLKKKILTLGALVEGSVQQAIKALHERDNTLADRVIEADIEIDQMEVETEEECLKILALYQPVAVDLRFVIAVLKINNDLERIADQAVNIAERVRYLSKSAPIPIPSYLYSMSENAQKMLENSILALVNLNADLAYEVIHSDEKVDSAHAQMYQYIQKGIRGNLDAMDGYINLLSISRQIERVADQATNIAEDVIYLARGEIVRHKSFI
jgi:phosphate transport system protein